MKFLSTIQTRKELTEKENLQVPSEEDYSSSMRNAIDAIDLKSPRWYRPILFDTEDSVAVAAAADDDGYAAVFHFHFHYVEFFRWNHGVGVAAVIASRVLSLSSSTKRQDLDEKDVVDTNYYRERCH